MSFGKRTSLGAPVRRQENSNGAVGSSPRTARDQGATPSLKPHLDTHGRGPRWLAPLAVAVIWGVNVPVMKGALDSMSPFAFNALRLSASAVTLGIADRIERRGAPAPRTPWRAVVGLGLLTSLLYQVLFIEGIARTSAIHAGFLIASGPLWTAVIARVSGLERLGARAWSGLAIAFVGTALVVLARGGGDPAVKEATLAGNGLMIAAMVTWGLGAVLSRPLLADMPATRLAFLFTSVALPGHWLLAASQLDSVWPAEGRGPGLAGWAAVLYGGVLSTGLAYSLWNASLRRIGPARTSAFTNLVPLVALAVAWITLGERPGRTQLAGGALVWVGIAAWRSAKAKAE